MHATAESLGIDRRNLAERILLGEEIWDSMAAEAEALEVPQSHRSRLMPGPLALLRLGNNHGHHSESTLEPGAVLDTWPLRL
jgi:hypothetical protein